MLASIFECVVGLLLIVGFIFEDNVARWEQSLFRKFKKTSDSEIPKDIVNSYIYDYNFFEMED